jgi:hypothetical protein
MLWSIMSWDDLGIPGLTDQQLEGVCTGRRLRVNGTVLVSRDVFTPQVTEARCGALAAGWGARRDWPNWPRRSRQVTRCAGPRTYPLEEVRATLAELEAGHLAGKIVLILSGPNYDPRRGGG